MFNRSILLSVSCAALCALVGSIPQYASASLSLTLDPSAREFSSGTATTGFFDVYLTSDALATDPDIISGYAIEIDVTGSGTGITFPSTGSVTEETSATNGLLFGAESNIEIFSNTGTSIAYSDFPTDSEPESISDGSIFGAGRIYFDIAANTTPGVYTLAFDPSGTSYLDGNLQSLNFAAVNNATITIRSAAVPEPTTTLLLILTGVAGLFFARFRRGRLPEPVVG